MTRTVPIALALLALGCKNDQNIQTQEAVLGFSPALLDLGVTSVGAPLADVIAVDHLGGIDGRILSIELQSDPDGHFAFDGLLPIDVDRGMRAELTMVFDAEAVGYFSATVQIVHSGKDSPATLDIRAGAVPPELDITPRSIDFGPVGVGDARTQVVTVANLGEAPVVLTERFLSDGAFTSDVDLPMTIDAGREGRIGVTFTPRGRDVLAGTLELFAGDTALPVVSLRGNDCEGGLPEAYDRDGDGVTSCGGDCNDDRDDIRPGAPEVADSADQDCDGRADEGTENADDDRDGTPEIRGDCNDANPDVNPDADEVIGNGIDDDCDGVVDVGGTDSDTDGFSPGGGDCDDTDPSIHPGATETANDADDDCDGTKDEGTVAYDDDGDGYCERSVNCTDGSAGGDCDDSAVTSGPGAPEVADGRDNDCDGDIDEGTAAFDDDGDGYTENGGDCNDANPAESPGLGTC